MQPVFACKERLFHWDQKYALAPNFIILFFANSTNYYYYIIICILLL